MEGLKTQGPSTTQCVTICTITLTHIIIMYRDQKYQLIVYKKIMDLAEGLRTSISELAKNDKVTLLAYMSSVKFPLLVC